MFAVLVLLLRLLAAKNAMKRQAAFWPVRGSVPGIGQGRQGRADGM